MKQTNILTCAKWPFACANKEIDNYEVTCLNCSKGPTAIVEDEGFSFLYLEPGYVPL